MILSKKRDAFTLIEVLIAVVIVGILATLATPGLMKKMRDMRLNATKGTMAGIESALVDYRGDMGRFPTEREGLEALIEKPGGKGSENWNGSYLKNSKAIPKDSWKTDFEYNLPPNIKDKSLRYYELISYGPTGEANESDYIHMGE